MFQHCCWWCDLFFLMCMCLCVVAGLSDGALQRAERGAVETVEAPGTASAQLAPRRAPQLQLELTPRSTMRNRSPYQTLLHPGGTQGRGTAGQRTFTSPHVPTHTHCRSNQDKWTHLLCMIELEPGFTGSWESESVYFEEDWTCI